MGEEQVLDVAGMQSRLEEVFKPEMPHVEKQRFAVRQHYLASTAATFVHHNAG